MAEDMDLTWNFYHAGHGVRFIPGAICYPIEPQTYEFMSKQLKRWSHGFVQNVKLHWRELLDEPYLRTMIAVSLWDAFVASGMEHGVVAGPPEWPFWPTRSSKAQPLLSKPVCVPFTSVV